MSPLSSTSDKPGGPYRKPRADVYTVMLLVALVALILGIVCLYAEMEDYQWKFKGGPTVTMDLPPQAVGWALPTEVDRTIGNSVGNAHPTRSVVGCAHPTRC